MTEHHVFDFPFYGQTKDLSATLDKMAADGWELVAVATSNKIMRLVMKREAVGTKRIPGFTGKEA